MISSFFHTPKSKKFNFTPRFYDEDAERHKEREERIKAELGIVDEADKNRPYRPNIKGQFRQVKGAVKSSAEERRVYNRRVISLIIILTLIMVAIYYMEDLLIFFAK